MNAENADMEARFAAPTERGLPPGRHELHREILMTHMLTPNEQTGTAPAKHRRRSGRRILAIGGTAGLGVTAAAVAVAVALSSTPAAPSRPLAGGRTAAPAASPAVTSPLMRVAAYITSSPHKQSGDATLVISTYVYSHPVIPDGSNINLFTDSGGDYFALTDSGLREQVDKHHNVGPGSTDQELAAAKYAVHGNLTIARQRMASLSGPVTKGWTAATITAKADELGVTAAPGQSLAAAVDKALTDSDVWDACLDTLVSGSGNAQVRAGVLRLFSTVSKIIITHGIHDGQPTLTVSDLEGDGSGAIDYKEALTLNARTGVPIKFTGGIVGRVPGVTTTYKISRVTVSAIAAGRF